MWKVSSYKQNKPHCDLHLTHIGTVIQLYLACYVYCTLLNNLLLILWNWASCIMIKCNSLFFLTYLIAKTKNAKGSGELMNRVGGFNCENPGLMNILNTSVILCTEYPQEGTVLHKEESFPCC